MEFTRVTVDPRQMGGVPCLRGFRIPVPTVVSLVAEQTVQQILALYPDLEAEDVREALLFATEAVRERTTPQRAGCLWCKPHKDERQPKLLRLKGLKAPRRLQLQD